MGRKSKKQTAKRSRSHKAHIPPRRARIFVAVCVGTVAVIFLILVSVNFSPKEIPCANTISCTETPKLEIETNATGIFQGKVVPAPNIPLSQTESTSPVLGMESTNGEKHIYVNLDTQTLSAYEGDTLFMETPISTGLWGWTPKGDFTIWTKIRSTKMSGGSGADFYDLPNVPYVMFFANSEVPASRGFSIHGTYWHNNFGHAMSHGCVNMKTTDVAKLFEWADGPKDGEKGTVITIHDNASIP